MFIVHQTYTLMGYRRLRMRCCDARATITVGQFYLSDIANVVVYEKYRGNRSRENREPRERGREREKMDIQENLRSARVTSCRATLNAELRQCWTRVPAGGRQLVHNNLHKSRPGIRIRRAESLISFSTTRISRNCLR